MTLMHNVNHSLYLPEGNTGRETLISIGLLAYLN